MPLLRNRNFIFIIREREFVRVKRIQTYRRNFMTNEKQMKGGSVISLCTLVSAFTRIVAAEFDAVSTDSAGFGTFSWFDTDSGEHWLTINCGNEGKLSVELYDAVIDELAMYAILGYCTYHNIPVHR
jgi:hypothetical protein